MDTVAIAALSLIGFGFAATAVALGVRSGSLRATISRLASDLNSSEKERDETRGEFESYQARTENQLESLRDEITDLQDLLATCSDPLVVHERLDRMLQKASSRHGSPSPD